MELEGVLQKNISDLVTALNLVTKSEYEMIENLSKRIARDLKKGSAIFWCGNGGSAAESQHMAAELMGRFLINRRPYRSISLTTDTSAITGISNDFSFDDIFSRQVDGLGSQGDFLIVFSTSGRSANILKALEMSKSKGITSIAFLGGDGGPALALADFSIVVNSNITARIQEVHTVLCHSLCQIIESFIENSI